MTLGCVKKIAFVLRTLGTLEGQEWPHVYLDVGSGCSVDNILDGVSKEVGGLTFWNIPGEWFLGLGMVPDMESKASITDKTLGLLGCYWVS